MVIFTFNILIYHKKTLNVSDTLIMYQIAEMHTFHALQFFYNLKMSKHDTVFFIDCLLFARKFHERI